MSASPILIEIVINVQINVKLGSLSPKRGQIFSRGLIDHRWPPFGGIWGILVWKIYKYCSKWNLKYLGAIHNFRRMVLKTLAPKMPIEHDHIRVINFQYYNFSCEMLPTNQAAKEALERIFPYIKMFAWFQSQKRIHACTKITCTKTTKLAICLDHINGNTFPTFILTSTPPNTTHLFIQKVVGKGKEKSLKSPIKEGQVLEKG